MDDLEFLKSVARELCIERRRSGLTQQEIYAATGINIGRIEANGQSMRLITYCKLCEFMKIPYEKILNRILHKSKDNRILKVH